MEEEEADHFKEEEDRFMEKEEDEDKDSSQNTMTKMQITKERIKVALFVEKQITRQRIVFSNARSAKILTILKGIAGIKIRMRKMKQTSQKMKENNFFRA